MIIGGGLGGSHTCSIGFKSALLDGQSIGLHRNSGVLIKELTHCDRAMGRWVIILEPLMRLLCT